MKVLDFCVMWFFLMSTTLFSVMTISGLRDGRWGLAIGLGIVATGSLWVAAGIFRMGNGRPIDDIHQLPRDHYIVVGWGLEKGTGCRVYFVISRSGEFFIVRDSSDLLPRENVASFWFNSDGKLEWQGKIAQCPGLETA